MGSFKRKMLKEKSVIIMREKVILISNFQILYDESERTFKLG